MILLDANLLLYAVNRDLPQHEAARDWLVNVLSGSEAVGFPWVVILAFLRISTSPRVFESPISVKESSSYVDEWLSLAVTRAVSPGNRHWSVLQNLLAASGTGGNLTTDAHIAALALEHGAVVYSTDNDFKRFAGVKHVNPLA